MRALGSCTRLEGITLCGADVEGTLPRDSLHHLRTCYRLQTLRISTQPQLIDLHNNDIESLVAIYRTCA